MYENRTRPGKEEKEEWSEYLNSHGYLKVQFIVLALKGFVIRIFFYRSNFTKWLKKVCFTRCRARENMNGKFMNKIFIETFPIHD